MKGFIVLVFDKFSKSIGKHTLLSFISYSSQQKLKIYLQIYQNSLFSLLFQFKIQFDDSLTATFEYPSETSLMIDETFGDEDEVDASFYGRSGSSSKLLTSVPLGKFNNSHGIDSSLSNRNSIYILSISFFIFRFFYNLRFNAIRQLPATKSECLCFRVGHHENNAIAIICFIGWEYIHF